jgi:Iron-containing redox enzyme
MASAIPALNLLHGASIQEHIVGLTDELLASFPNPEHLSAEQRRGIVARYTAVLEGNFIYWMTGALLAVRSEEARAIILENLHEEVRDCHPGMMRRFAIAAEAVPTDSDAAAVYHDLTNVRLFVGRLEPVQLVLMMTFFEGLLQRFMPYLAELARLQGSQEMEYTDVHGVCDIAHTEGLYRALEAESLLCPLEPGANPFQGVEVLRALLQNIVFGSSSQPLDLRIAE